MRGPNRGGVLATNIISSPITVVPVLVKLIGSGVETIRNEPAANYSRGLSGRINCAAQIRWPVLRIRRPSCRGSCRLALPHIYHAFFFFYLFIAGLKRERGMRSVIYGLAFNCSRAKWCIGEK